VMTMPLEEIIANQPSAHLTDKQTPNTYQEKIENQKNEIIRLRHQLEDLSKHKEKSREGKSLTLPLNQKSLNHVN
jgi:hypothetical protein